MPLVHLSAMSIIELQRLPKIEKLRIIEVLWDGLAGDVDEIEPPAWHVNELAKTEERLRKGEEEVLDWRDAKAELRERFE